jgi:hypothetical protein
MIERGLVALLLVVSGPTGPYARQSAPHVAVEHGLIALFYVSPVIPMRIHMDYLTTSVPLRYVAAREFKGIGN